MKPTPGDRAAQHIEQMRADVLNLKPSELSLQREVMDAILSGEADIVLRSPASAARYCQLTNAVEILRDMQVKPCA